MGRLAANLYRALCEHRPDLAYRPGGVQPLRTDVNAVHDCPAAEEPVGIFQIVQASGGRVVARIGDEAIGLQQPGGTNELVRVPPVRWACGGTAGA
jgi:hypothetical protein